MNGDLLSLTTGVETRKGRLMKLLYTDMSQDLTEILTEQATSYAQKGKRVFYIAPNALSFEKERKVLEYLPQSASFEITVTRFTQMARYFILNTSNPKTQLDDTGLAMIFYKVLSHMDDDELKVYGRLRKDSNFINQLVDLYKELQQANMTVLDLQHLDQAEKQEDLVRIFSAVQNLLLAGDFDNQSKLSAFFKEITSGHLDKALSNTVLVIDGFTRFSAEEEALVALLNDKCHQIVIGTYASQKAYKANFVYGNVYQTSVDFLRTLAQTYKVTPDYVTTDKEGNPSFARISRLLESRHDFSTVDEKVTDQDKQALQVWEVVNQKEEVAQVAKSIRQLLADGKRYKDILVLLGDEESYKLQVGQIFRKFDIPYYFGKEETMSSHPLVQFVDSLERIKRYNYRAEDLLNLVKSGLYGGFTQEDLDLFEYYVNFADIKGRHKFLSDFTANSRDKYDLDQLNALRSQLVEPLDKLLNSRKQKGSSLLKKLVVFLGAVQVPNQMAALTVKASEAEKEQNKQVWKAFTQLLEQVETIFGEETLSVDDFLSILRSGMLACDYRTVPATVDVVNVKKYDLIQPHSAPYVFALGMTQSHFPKVGQNKSLLSDEERSRINEATDEHRSLDIVTQSNSQRGHFVAMSLFNAASEQLVLSQPQILNETQDDMSVYLKELLDLGLPLVEKGRNRFEAKGDQIGNYKDLLSTVIALNSSHLDDDLDKETQTFWSVAVRYLRKRLDKEQVLIPNVIDDVTTTKVDDQVMQLVFPGEEPLKLSASALTTFYNNQYLYFLRYVLGLEELESIHPDARHHGTYLHRVFERVMGDSSSENFDDKLEKAIAQTNQEQPFELLYTEDQESRLSRQILEDIARSTASVLRDNAAVKVEREEAKFDLLLANSIKITGIIDRVDRLMDGALGVVDYKSGKNVFDIQKFYNGLSPQLVTYLEALRQTYKVDADQLFGAMYLHMQDPQLNLVQFGLDKLAAQANKELTYKGLFVASETEHLAGGNYDLQKTVTYDKEDLETLLDYNIKLFTDAAEIIRSGNFAVNPYTEDGKSVQGDQIKAITHFEADRHMGQARKLLRLPSKGKKEAYLELMTKDEDKNQMQVAENIIPFLVTNQAVKADKKDQEDNHVD